MAIASTVLVRKEVDCGNSRDMRSDIRTSRDERERSFSHWTESWRLPTGKPGTGAHHHHVFCMMCCKTGQEQQWNAWREKLLKFNVRLSRAHQLPGIATVSHWHTQTTVLSTIGSIKLSHYNSVEKLWECFFCTCSDDMYYVNQLYRCVMATNGLNKLWFCKLV